LDANREVSLEVNAEKTKYMFMSHHVAKFRHVGTVATNQNGIHEEIKSKV
jgi:hypothetical protein